MLRTKVMAGMIAAASVLGLMAAPAAANQSSPRQYYGAWHKHDSNGYHYRHYYHMPSADYAGYRHHYVIYHPPRPKYYYFYNPYTKTYWGRCPVKTDGKGQYSMLAEKDRKGSSCPWRRNASSNRSMRLYGTMTRLSSIPSGRPDDPG
jgi:hypothetical protein